MKHGVWLAWVNLHPASTRQAHSSACLVVHSQWLLLLATGLLTIARGQCDATLPNANLTWQAVSQICLWLQICFQRAFFFWLVDWACASINCLIQVSQLVGSFFSWWYQGYAFCNSSLRTSSGRWIAISWWCNPPFLPYVSTLRTPCGGPYLVKSLLSNREPNKSWLSNQGAMEFSPSWTCNTAFPPLFEWMLQPYQLVCICIVVLWSCNLAAIPMSVVLHK